MIRFFIVFSLVFPFLIQASKDCQTEASITQSADTTEKSGIDSTCSLQKEKKKKKVSAKKKSYKSQAKEEEQKVTSTEDYSPPSLSESLNDSNSLKNEIKRQLSAEEQPTQLESTTEEVADFGNLSVSISERKKEETLVQKKQTN